MGAGFLKMKGGGKVVNVKFFPVDQTPIEIYDKLVDKYYLLRDEFKTCC